MNPLVIHYELLPEEVNIILRSLAEMPFKDVSSLIAKLKEVGDKAIADAAATDIDASTRMKEDEHAAPLTGDVITPAGEVVPATVN